MGELALQIGSILKWAGIALSPALLLPIAIILTGFFLSRVSERFSSALDSVSTALLELAKYAALIMVFTQLAVIVGRYVYGWSASWLNETVTYSFGAMFILAVGSALKHDAHVRVDIFRGQMSDRLKAIIDLIGTYCFLFPVCILVLWSVSRSSSFLESWLHFEGSRESDGLPIYFLFRTLIPIFAVALMLQGLSQGIKAALIIRGLGRFESKSEHSGVA